MRTSAGTTHRADGGGGTGWCRRLLLDRVRHHAPVVLVVALVAVTATTLVGVLAGLLHATEHHAVPQTLSRLTPEQVRLESVLWVRGDDVAPVLEDAREAVAQITGDVPTTDDTWLVGTVHALPSVPGRQPELTYLTAMSRPPARLLTGRWPQGAVDADGRVEVSVPAVAAELKGWQVGTTIDVRPWQTEDLRTWVVVGTYEPEGPPGAWSRDRLRGTGMSSTYNVPGGVGMLTTTAWGPLVADAAALHAPGEVDTAYLITQPRLADASAAAVTQLRAAVRDGDETLAAALGQVGGRLMTDVGATIDATWRELVVTRAGVVTVGLLLATLTTTVMLLTARLLAERRAVEDELLAARGASAGQLRSLVVLEALGMATLTWVVALPAAGLALGVAGRSGAPADAGYDVGSVVPGGAPLACGVMAAVLAATLCAPAWHTAGSSAGTAHAPLLRVGADIGLLVLGALAMWQLVVYGSPLAGGTAGPRLDPVLVAGPALVTLAAATVALRAVAPAARVAERLAGRARSFVVPLAAWQLARRPSVATGTVLVVVVAVAAGTFASAFSATWRTSQREQVDLALGTDLRLDDVSGPSLTVSDALARATAGHPDAHGQPVTDRAVSVGAADNTAGVSARLVALDATRPQDLRGHTDVPWSTVLDGLAEGRPATVSGTAVPLGTAVPPGTQWLVVDGVVGTDPVAGGTALVGVTVEDERGVLVQLTPRSAGLGEEFRAAYEIPPAGPVRIVAVDTLVSLDTPAHADPPGTAPRARLPVRVSLTAVRAVARSERARTADAARTAASSPVPLDDDGWSASLAQDEERREAEVGGAAGAPSALLDVASTMDHGGSDLPSARLLARAWPAAGPVPVAAGSSLLERVDAASGNLTLTVGGVAVPARVTRYVDTVPGVPRGIGLVADGTTLARAVLEAGGAPDLTDSWWVAAPTATAATVAGGLGGLDAVVTTRAGRQLTALTGPISVAMPAALSVVGASAALLVLVGTGAVAAASLRARRLELARLQALGASRAGLVGGLVAETTLLVAVGALVGLLTGYALAAVVAPLLTMSPDGRTPAPEPWLVWGWGGQSLWTTTVAAGACAVAAAVAVLGVRRTSGAALRMGDDR